MTSLLSSLAPRRLAAGRLLPALDIALPLERMARVAAATVATWRARARARRDLAAMDDRMRRDIGLSRYQVLNETNKPFWRA